MKIGCSIKKPLLGMCYIIGIREIKPIRLKCILCHLQKNFIVIYLKISNEKLVNLRQTRDKTALSLGILKFPLTLSSNMMQGVLCTTRSNSYRKT